MVELAPIVSVIAATGGLVTSLLAKWSKDREGRSASHQAALRVVKSNKSTASTIGRTSIEVLNVNTGTKFSISTDSSMEEVQILLDTLQAVEERSGGATRRQGQDQDATQISKSRDDDEV